MDAEDANRAERAKDRDAVIAEQIAILEGTRGPVLIDLAEWALTSLRHEQALRSYLLFLGNDALNRSSEIKLALATY